MQLRRRLLKALAAAGLFGPAGISGLIGNALAKGNAPVAPGVHKLRGTVSVNGKPAREGQLVGAGDTVVTGPGSEAIYVIGQDAFLQRESSTVNFGADVALNLMRVVTGKLLSVFGKGARTIQVSTATIGIRGTGCYIEDEGAGATARTYFCLCYGDVELTPGAAPQEAERYSTTHHDKPMYIHNDMKMPKMMVPAGVINHSDDELKLLEALVGRWPPFYGQGGPRY
ncbi:hypothetical protein [Sulfuritalea hydrogenivorans]|uniref:FecR protein domain-containing protein n=1 Tax=Sulfuritalea hydrogenivorans sk43H TaxID=1223802 RepID=W0SDJ6_9PROT|nr:hypothetical protein [Sulfuritalea hydrogenivorans]BAO28835.1 hypothetical protein SUTH_01029 [Sulfuritalea hydrogenivorans sk43H]